MKKLSNITFAAILLGGVQLLQTGCTDMEGDGIGSIEWGGSTNVEAVSYHNPVWEPSLEGGTLVVTSTNFVAIGGETQWAVGVDYCCPSIYSSTSMIWETNQQVSFTAANRPKWISGRINSLSVDYCTVSEEITVDDAETTVSASRYFMAYSTDKDDAIGIASSVSAQGPYVDHGCLLTASSLGAGSLRDPFVMATDANEIYIGYTLSEGSYVQKIRIPYSVTSSNGIVFDAAALPKLDGEPVKVSSASFGNIAMFREAGRYFIFGDVDGEVRYATASSATGPYRSGAGDLMSTNGDLFIQAGTEYTAPSNVMRVIKSANGYWYVAYNACSVSQSTMPSGYDRRPMFLSPFQINGEKITSVIIPEEEWTSPRFDK